MATTTRAPIRTVSRRDLDREVEHWKAAHPGFDESNYFEYFKDADGNLDEDADGFDEADTLFAIWRAERNITPANA